MAFAATTMLELLVLITWACLTVPDIFKNALFTQFFYCQEVLSEICSTASLCFCPGLFDAVQAASPPSIEFFKGLPTNDRKRWAVYAIVLEKSGAIPLVYIGSGTNALYGVSARWGFYNRLDFTMMPRHVCAALKDGYEITHKGILVWCSLPAAAKVPIYRLLFLAMEAAFTYTFWAVKSRLTDHSMISCCPWALSSFTYGGLGSHNPLIELAAGDFNLSSEELEAVAAEAKKLKRQTKIKYEQSHKEEIKANKKLYQASEHGKKILRNNQATFRKNHPEKKAANSQRYNEKVKALKKFYCAICDSNCSSPADLRRHNATQRHLQKVKAYNATVAAATEQLATPVESSDGSA